LLLLPAEMLAVGTPLFTLVKANFALVVELEPSNKSSVCSLSNIAPFPSVNGEPPLSTGRMPVTSLEPPARFTALVERLPLISVWTIPTALNPVNWILPADVIPWRPVIVPVAVRLPLFAMVNFGVPAEDAEKISPLLV